MAWAAVVLTNAIDYGWSFEHLRLRKRGCANNGLWWWRGF